MAVDIVGAPSIRADGTPDQTPGYELSSGGTGPGAQPGGTGIQITSGQAGANFPWLLTGGGDVVYGYGTLTYLWTPGPGEGTGMGVGLVGAPISGVAIFVGLVVSNLAGDERIVVIDTSAVTDATAEGLRGHSLTGAAQVNSQVGTDLSFDPEADVKRVVSAAGGAFIVQALVSVTND